MGHTVCELYNKLYGIFIYFVCILTFDSEKILFIDNLIRVGQSLFLEKSESLFFLLKRAKKERKSDLLLLRSFALFEKSERAIRSIALFLKE